MKNLFLIIIFICISKNSYSNNLFDSSFYDIEFESQNIEDDKIKQIEIIKKNSILSILNKTLYKQKYEEVKNYLSEDLINTFIKNIIIEDEKIINDIYKSKIKINFDKNKIVNFYREKNIPYVEYYPKKFLLIIYEENKISNNLFSENNQYYSYYNDNLKNNKFFKIPKLDINDRFILNKEHLLERNIDKIKNFSDKYNLDETIIVIVKKNNNKVNYDLILYTAGAIFEKKLKLNINKFDVFFKNLEKESISIWKKNNLIQNNYTNLIKCKVSYFNMFELKEIRNYLDNISVIKDLKVKSLSNKNIEYDIYYYGNFQLLMKIFELNKLKINNNKKLCEIKLK